MNMRFEDNEIAVFYRPNRMVNVRRLLDGTYSFMRIRLEDGEILEHEIRTNLESACSAIKHFIGLTGKEEEIAVAWLFKMRIKK